LGLLASIFSLLRNDGDDPFSRQGSELVRGVGDGYEDEWHWPEIRTHRLKIGSENELDV
jgi:hypothetical protein